MAQANALRSWPSKLKVWYREVRRPALQREPTFAKLSLKVIREYMTKQERSFFGIPYYVGEQSPKSQSDAPDAEKEETVNDGNRNSSITDQTGLIKHVGAAAATALWLVVFGLPATLLLSLFFTGFDLLTLGKIASVYLGIASVLIILAFLYP
jgi:hypothetical protein